MHEKIIVALDVDSLQEAKKYRDYFEVLWKKAKTLNS